MKVSIHQNAMSGLWILYIDCKYKDSNKYLRLIIKVIVKTFGGRAITGRKRRIKSGRHYLIQDQIVELHAEEWMPLFLASKEREILEKIKDIFVILISDKNPNK